MRRMVNSPLMIGSAYLLLIPGFGFLYTSFPGEFFHSTSIHEPTTKAAKDAVGVAIQQELRLLGKQAASDDSGLEIDLTSAEVSDTLIRGETAEVVVKCKQRASARERGEWRSSRIKLEFHFSELEGGTGLGSIFPITLSNGQVTYAFFTESFLIKKETLIAQRTYSRAVGGFPQGGMVHFWRMTYFSAITITTTGYGDILPLTDRARILAGAQATLGVVLVGLFLNALANRIGSSPKKSPQPTGAALPGSQGQSSPGGPGG